MNPLFRIDFSISDSLKIVRKSVLIYETIIQSFDPVPSSSTEKEESTGRRIHLKLILDNGTESVNGFPHIGVAADNVDLLKSGDVT